MQKILMSHWTPEKLCFHPAPAKCFVLLPLDMICFAIRFRFPLSNGFCLSLTRCACARSYRSTLGEFVRMVDFTARISARLAVFLRSCTLSAVYCHSRAPFATADFKSVLCKAGCYGMLQGHVVDWPLCCFRCQRRRRFFLLYAPFIFQP